jgi:Glycosyltransferase family 87
MLPTSASKYLQNGTRIVLWCLLLLAAAEFILRGPVRYLHPTNWNDLAQYYATSRIWQRGQNFADPQKFGALWRDELQSPMNPNTARMHISPPPGALVLFAPIAALPWTAARLVWLVALLAGFTTTVAALLKFAGLSPLEARGLAFVAGCLALAPFHTGIATGNQTILVVGLCAFGIWAAGCNRDIIAGLSFGVACSLKPHIAGFFLLYYLLHRRWRLMASAITLAVVLVMVAAAWMQLAGVAWLPDYLNNIKFGATHNSFDDFTSANPIRFMLINLQVPFYSFTHSARSANLLAFCVGAALIIAWIILVFRNRRQEVELLSLSTIAVIGLLPLYHRLYDASVLVFPLLWCLTQSSKLTHIANTALLLMAPFLVPGAAVLQQMQNRIPESWTTSWWWDGLVMPHQTWVVLFLSLVLILGMVETRNGSGNSGKALHNIRSSKVQL